jgi:hypothetical protein
MWIWTATRAGGGRGGAWAGAGAGAALAEDERPRRLPRAFRAVQTLAQLFATTLKLL